MTARGGRAARLLAVFAVLLGLLAMHGLVSAHHSPAAAAVPSSAPGTGPGTQHHMATAPPHADPEGSAAQDLGGHLPVGPAATSLVALPDGHGLDGGCTDCPTHGVAALCLAVLSVGLALLAGLARRARAGGLPSPHLPVPVLRAGPLPAPRPPDLVAGLCVSRT